MATNLVVNFIGNNKLSKTTTVIGNDLKKLQRTTEKVSRGMNSALGAVGLGVGIAKLTGFLKDSAKAAAEDNKAKNLLALALQNTVGASKSAIASTEEWIQTTSNSVAVLDDELRPALAVAVTATGDLSAGQKLLNTALNLSAYTGKDLQSVTGALSKAYNGQTTSLKKLVPGLDLTGDYMQRLDVLTAGAAETAGDSDPFKKLNNIFENLKETIGNALLPYLQEFADYLVSPEGQAQIQRIADTFIAIARAVGAVISLVTKNITLFGVLAIAVVAVKLAIGGMTLAMKLYTMATRIGKMETQALKIAIASTGIGLLVVAVGTLAALWGEATANVSDYNDEMDDATNANEVSFYNGNYLLPGQAPANGWQNFTPLVDAINDPRLTAEMKEALKGQLNKVIKIDYLKGRIYADGKLIWSRLANGAKEGIEEGANEIKNALTASINKVKTTAEKFRDAIGIAFGARGEDENTIFNVDFLLGKLRRIAQAAKGFGANIAKIVKLPGGQAVANQLISMGPAAGNIAAKALLASPTKLNEIIGLQGGLYTTGASAQSQVETAVPNATYEININKAVISASDIIKEIRILEKKTGRKYLVG